MSYGGSQGFFRAALEVGSQDSPDPFWPIHLDFDTVLRPSYELISKTKTFKVFTKSHSNSQYVAHERKNKLIWKYEFWFRLFNELSEVFQPLLMILFVWALMTMCGSMLMIQMEIVKSNVFHALSNMLIV